MATVANCRLLNERRFESRMMQMIVTPAAAIMTSLVTECEALVVVDSKMVTNTM
jgi:hypothetical protein